MTEPTNDGADARSDNPREVLANHFLRPEQEFLDPVHGFVYYTKTELEIINHPAFQRLFNINQLGQTHLVFRGATHRRGEHALGTVGVAQRMIDSVNHVASLRSSEGRSASSETSTVQWSIGATLHPAEVIFIRLAALLHDIGHIVVGHTLEDELGFLPSHDSRSRVEQILDYDDWGQDHIAEHQSLKPIGIRSLRETINDTFKPIEEYLLRINPDYNPHEQGLDNVRYTGTVSSSEVLLAIVSKVPEHDLRIAISPSSNSFFGLPGDPSAVPSTIPSQHLTLFPMPSINVYPEFRLQVARDIVGNTVCADLIDYLERDSLHLGKPRKFDTRLFQYMSIREPNDGTPSRLVVELDTEHPGQIRPDVLSGILELLENRYRLWEIAILHKTKTCASAMLERALVEMASHTDLFSRNADSVNMVSQTLLSHLLELSDNDLYLALAQFPWDSYAHVGQVVEETEHDVPSDKVANESALELLSRLRYRQLYKEVDRITDKGDNNLTQQIAERLTVATLDIKTETDSSLDEDAHAIIASQINKIEAARRRTNSLRQLEHDFDLEHGSLVMYCSPWGLGTKVAAVQVFHHNMVKKLSELAPSPQAAGGFLQAQLNRFIQLWRASLFILPDALERLKQRDLIDVLALAFRVGVAGCDLHPLTMETIAAALAGKSGRPTYADNTRMKSIDEWEEDVERWKTRAARDSFVDGTVYEKRSPMYPSGKPTLRSLFRG